jgi:hypothetical protein
LPNLTILVKFRQICLFGGPDPQKAKKKRKRERKRSEPSHWDKKREKERKEGRYSKIYCSDFWGPGGGLRTPLGGPPEGVYRVPRGPQ